MNLEIQYYRGGNQLTLTHDYQKYRLQHLAVVVMEKVVKL